MNIMMFIIFLITDLICVGAFVLVYRHIDEYKEGMLFGIHIPREGMEEEEVQKLTAKFRKDFRMISWINWILGIGVCFLCFVSFGVFLVIWCIWLALYIYYGVKISTLNMRKMYKIKTKYNWIFQEQQNKVHIDTNLSLNSNKSNWSALWHIPVFFIIAAEMVVLYIMQNHTSKAQMDSGEIIIIGTLFSTSILFWLLHILFIKKKNKVYSKNSDINVTANQLWKRTWSIVFILINYCNLAAVSFLFYAVVKNHWIGNTDIYIYLIFSIVPVFVLLAGAYYIMQTTKEILSFDTQAVVVDDDIYWKNGWYYNPNDKTLLVQDRINTMNMSLNFARPMAKGILIATAAVVVACFLLVGVLGYSADHAKIEITQKNQEMQIKGSLYHTDIKKGDVISVKIIQKLPKDSYIRTNGMSTDTIAIGHYRGRKIGKCEMYLLTKYKPILEIKTKDELIFVNSKEKDKVQQWYQMLSSK